MDDVVRQLAGIEQDFTKACRQIGLTELEANLETLRVQQLEPDFWQDTQHAQAITKEFAALDTRLRPWFGLRTRLQEMNELAALGDASILDDLQRDRTQFETDYAALKGELAYAGPHDHDSAILSIYAGAGGTDAQDWAGMLLRMYVRWAEQHALAVTTLDQSAGEEAGLKSVMLQIEGALAYGKLKGEHGVHRLVRLSPFNADNLRQTSFAKVEVLPKVDSPESIEIDDKDLKIDVYRSGGHGGQSVNTTDSAVRITHLPTGIIVAIQNERSQLQNRETAMTILRSKLVQLQMEQHLEKIADLKGPNQSAEWGNQIRSYVLHPYTMVKDLRTRHETSDSQAVLDGDLDAFIAAYTAMTMGSDT